MIEEQITLVTTGSTHGGIIKSVALVGEIEAGSSQVTNLASTDGLAVGQMYELAGSGITDGTLFIYDDNSLISGRAGSLNITDAATASLKSVTLTATAAVEVGAPVATLVAGSDTVTLDITLAAGRYCISGVGLNADPDGVAVASAFLDWDGSSGSMWTLVATSSTTSGEDMFGVPIEITTYTVAAEAVTATAGGTLPVVLTGLPSDDFYSITDIPAGALGSLMPGLRYNINGNGIPVGSTFVADPSATSIELDQPASSAELSALLTIGGPRTPNAPFDPAAHNRFDEDIVSLEISQEEGGFATLTATIRNPNVGLLAVGRNLWCWLSWDQAWPAGPPDLVPLFNGRLVGVPKLQAGETVELQFLARPDDYNAQKSALADSLRVLPYYDPVWLAGKVTTDTVLEAYSQLWHVDRTTLDLTVSDILQGEDGTLVIGEDVSFYDSFSLAYGQPPIDAARVEGTVSWSQQAEGIIDITRKVAAAFDEVKAAPFGLGFSVARNGTRRMPGSGGGALIQGLSDGLINDWPKPGANIGGGWSFSNLSDPNGTPLNYIIQASKNNKGGWINAITYTVKWSGPTPGLNDSTTAGYSSNVQAYAEPINSLSAAFPINTYKFRMNVEYRADRKRTETVSAVVTADVQRELSDSAESDQEAITFTSDYVAQGVDENGQIPIGDLSLRSYFQTARGDQSLQYLLLAARAKIRARARAVDITFAVPWTTALGINLRNSITYFDRRLPGGSATGKVKSYKLSAAEGRQTGEFTIGCCIGNGTPSEAEDGINSYVEDGYTDDYQVVAGGQVLLLPDELAYETLDNFIVVDDGLDLGNLTADEVVNYVTVVDGLKVQLDALKKFQGKVAPMDGGDPISTARELTTTVTLDLKPVAGAEFHTNFFPAISQLSLPKTIDLGAPT